MVLVETDNMSAFGAVNKMASSSADMAELLRRLLDVAETHDIEIRCCHTPGEKLQRPDQSSRGDRIQEPRACLRASEFESVAARFGPFTDVIGPERKLLARPLQLEPPQDGPQQESRRAPGGEGGRAEEPPTAEPPQPANVFLHPTFDTVGSALRFICERASRDPEMSAVVVVPDEQTAGWQKLTRHFSVEGRWRGGSAHLMALTGRPLPTSRATADLVCCYASLARQDRPVARW